MRQQIVVVATALCLVLGRPPLSIRVGGLIDKDDQLLDSALRSSVKHVNQDQDLLNQTRIDTDIQFTEGDQFNVHISACQEVSYSVLTLLSSCGHHDSVVSSVTEHTHIPHLSMEVVSMSKSSSFSLYMAPSQEDIQLAVTDILTKINAPTVGLVSHSRSGFLNVQSMVEGVQMSGIEVVMADLTNKDIRPDLVRIRNEGVQVIVVDIGTSLVEVFVTQAMQSGILHSQSTVIFTSLDFVSINLEVARLTGANLMGFSLLDWQTLEEKNLNEDLKLLVEQDYRAALMFDSIQLFGKTVEVFSQDRDPVNPRVNCQDPEKVYAQGEELMAVYRNMSFGGITGNIRFGESRQHRQEMKLILLGLEDTGMVKTLGSWERTGGRFKVDVNLVHVAKEKGPVSKFKKPIRIGSVLSNFLRKNEHSQALEGNHRYFGFHKDLLDSLAKQIQFEYELIVEEDPTKYNPATGKWSGLVGKLIDGDVDVAVGDITINSEISTVLDFSLPFMTSQLVAVMKKAPPCVSYPSLATLLSPFSGSMWASLLGALLIASLILPLIARISPYERRSIRKDNAGLTFLNSLWLIFSGLFLQSVDIPLKAVSTRAFCCCCWLLTLVILLLYSSSLYRLLSLPVEKQSLDKLLEDPTFQFGVVANSSTENLLEHSKSPVLQSMWSRLDSSLLIPSLQAGANQAINSSLVLLVDSIQVEQLPTSLACDLETVGSLGPLYYSLGFKRGSHLTQTFNPALLDLEESGKMEQILNKWTKKRQCKTTQTHSGIALPFYGCLLFLVVGGLVAFLLSLVELAIYCLSSSSTAVTPWGVLRREIQAILARKNTEKEPAARSPIYLNGNNGSVSPNKQPPVYGTEDSVTHKLISHKREEERMENSRL